ncbi:fucose 4-O-acetylase-like acetyltransferase [Maribacter spongiicola]|uniref:Fucose 4-O-acetylase-like acetyltransferase n=1 Tax=Maribacter spongiicola TaxID=1206753 RepID=A0A4V3ERM6_9FLAO|nr:acyltransferase family protein [Maribacter spongiicola]TDT46733.1 fucose 4-O-acetylase-like acetyltransferase [Maribacter spongiicola]
MNTRLKPRFTWIDNTRGLMIILVAMGHIIIDGSIDNTFNTIIRMPTFFMISGFLFKFKPKKVYLKHKSIHLLLPYFVYLIPILAVQMYFEDKTVMEYFGRLLLGGPFLYAWTGVFWFITCLFFTQQIFNLLNSLKVRILNLVMILMLILAYLDDFIFNFNIPWSLNICLYTCPLFFIGFLFKTLIKNKTLPALVSILILCILYFITTNIIPESYTNLKEANYGIPLLGIAISTLSAFCLISFFKSIPEFKLLAVIGKASMIIMYLHLPIRYLILHFQPNTNQWFILFISLLIPTALYYLLNRNKTSRLVLLGES